MQAGKLRHRISIQAPPVTGGNPFEQQSGGAWTDVWKCWARIQSADPRAIADAGLQAMQVSHIVTIRYPGAAAQILPGYQILYGTRVFQIVKGLLNDEERNIQLQFFAWEINPPQGGQLA